MQMADKWRIIRSAGSLEEQFQRLVQTLGRPWLYLQKTTCNPKYAPLRRRARGMTTNTKSGWNPTEGGSEKESSAHANVDKWRKDFLEKQADPRKKFEKVKAAPVRNDESWWTPDPLTGVYVPEYYHGYVTTTSRATRKKVSGLGASSYERKETDLDRSQGPWFDNMEELPDMERHKKT